MNNSKGEYQEADSLQERVRENTGEIREVKRVTAADEEEMLRAIEREHKTVAIVAAGGEVVDALITEGDHFQSRCVEHEVIQLLKELERDKEQPRIHVMNRPAFRRQSLAA